MQSARFDRGFAHESKDVKVWKKAVTPYIREACKLEKPSRMPFKVTSFTYVFRAPKSTKKSVMALLEQKIEIPYLAPADITDNLNKGIVDCCKGIIFEDDRQIWHTCDIKKIYGLTDGIILGFEETPFVMTIDGVPAYLAK